MHNIERNTAIREDEDTEKIRRIPIEPHDAEISFELPEVRR